MGDLLTYFVYFNVVMYTFFSVGMISDVFQSRLARSSSS